VLDLETSIRNSGEDAIGKFRADPFHPENQIVSAGLTGDSGYTGWYYLPYSQGGWEGFGKMLSEYDLWVGQNIKFDLLYLMRCVPNIKEVLPYKKIWCTQLAEYLLTGQEVMYSKLGVIAPQYGGTSKPDKIKEYWDTVTEEYPYGVPTEEIPEQELMDYMKGDVMNTELVFKAQYRKALELGMLTLIESQMEALLATTEMAYNGMHFNKPKALEYALQVEDRLKEPLDIVHTHLMVALPHHDVNPGSTDQVSLYLFGGSYDIPVKVPWLDEEGEKQYIKSGPNKGNLKVRNGTDIVLQPTLFIPDERWRVKKEGFYSVDDFVLQQVKARTTDEGLVEFIDALLEVRNYEKELSTYLYGFADLAWPTTAGGMEEQPDGSVHFEEHRTQHYIHGSIGHCGTVTGRTNSSKPNLQNLSGREDE